MRPVVYISGPLTNGESLGFDAVDENVRLAAEKYKQLSALGFACVLPHLTWYLHRDHKVILPHAEWLEIDVAIIAKCDAVFRLPGRSAGADIECDFAAENGVPVFYDVMHMRGHFDARGVA